MNFFSKQWRKGKTHNNKTWGPNDSSMLGEADDQDRRRNTFGAYQQNRFINHESFSTEARKNGNLYPTAGSLPAPASTCQISTLNGSNSSTTSSVTSNAGTGNLVANNSVMASLSSLSKSSGSPIVSQHSIKYEDQLNYASLSHSQSTHSQLNPHPAGQPAHLTENGANHLLNNGTVDSLATHNSYHTMNQLSTGSPMGFHQLNSNVYASKPHLSPANGFLSNNYNQFNHASGPINSTPGYDFWNLNYDGYSNGYNFCSP